jgi:RNA polymerase sigma-70 factor (ECF subfamily)
MHEQGTGDVTRLLREWSSGDQGALERLLPTVYDELRRIASSQFKRERGDHTLQPTALIHEAYLRLVQQNAPDLKSRTHFFGIASRLMRQILVDYARSHQAQRRGGDQQKLQLDDPIVFSRDKAVELVAIGDALDRLAELDARKCQVIEMRAFAGMSVEETAQALGVSIPTVKRDMRIAKAWLLNELEKTA